MESRRMDHQSHLVRATNAVTLRSVAELVRKKKVSGKMMAITDKQRRHLPLSKIPMIKLSNVKALILVLTLPVVMNPQKRHLFSKISRGNKRAVLLVHGISRHRQLMTLVPYEIFGKNVRLHEALMILDPKRWHASVQAAQSVLFPQAKIKPRRATSPL